MLRNIMHTGRRRSLPHEMLPQAGPRLRWTPKVKAALLRAIEGGQISLEEAEGRYRLSSKEIGLWRDDQQAGGLKGLRVTRGDSRARRLAVTAEVPA